MNYYPEISTSTDVEFRRRGNRQDRSKGVPVVNE